VYLGVGKASESLMRWLVLVAFSAFNAYATLTMKRGFSKVVPGLRHETIEANHDPTPWIWKMPGSEVALAVFAAVIFTVPSDAVLAAFAVLYLTVSGIAVTVLVIVVFVVVVLFLIHKVASIDVQDEGAIGTSSQDFVHERPGDDETKDPEEFADALRVPQQTPHLSQQQITAKLSTRPTFDVWLLLYFFITANLAVAAVLFWVDAASFAAPSSTVSKGHFILLAAGLCLIPYFALFNDLKSRFDSELFHYTEGQASGIIYFRNLLTVLLKVPLLVINWFVLQALMHQSSQKAEDDEWVSRHEVKESGSVLVVSVVILALFFAYFAVVDRRWCTSRWSAAKLVNSIAGHWRNIQSVSTPGPPAGP